MLYLLLQYEKKNVFKLEYLKVCLYDRGVMHTGKVKISPDVRGNLNECLIMFTIKI